MYIKLILSHKNLKSILWLIPIAFVATALQYIFLIALFRMQFVILFRFRLRNNLYF